MKTTTARLALPALATLLALPLGGCKLPYQILSKLVAPKPTPTPTPIPAQSIAAEFRQFTEDRVRGEGQSPSAEVTAELVGTKQSSVASVRVVAKKAVDDLGTDLLPEKPEEAYFESVSHGSSGEDEGPLAVTVKMKNAPRKAKLLKEVTADAELYMPAVDPAATVTIPKFLGEAGKPIVNPVLQAAGIEITILSKEQIEAERKANGEKKRAEAKTYLQGEALETAVRFATENFLAASWVNAYLRVKDPKGAIFDYVYVKPSGEVEGINRGGEEGYVSLSAQGGEVGPDWGLQVRLKTPKTFARYTFTLKDVALP